MHTKQLAPTGGKTRYLAIICLLLLVPALILGLGTAGLATHTNSKYGYRLQYPADWQVREQPDSGWFEASALSDKASLPSVFGVHILPLEGYEGDLAPYQINCEMALLQELQGRNAKDIQMISAREISLGQNPALRFDYSYAQYGSLRMREISVRMPHQQWQYILTCSGEDGWYFDQSTPDFESILASFSLHRPNQEYLDNYIRVRADLSGAACVYHWKGKAYSFIPGERRKELFGVEGYNIVRAIPDEKGYLLLGKEVMLFLDSQSGEILSTWFNPISGKDVPVIHVLNDPANMDLRFSDEQYQMLRLILPSTRLDGQIAWHNDLFPFYPSALPRREYPLFSQSDIYQAADISQYLADLKDLDDPLQKGVPAQYSFTRVYPWLPFMRMGERPGNLILVCRGIKLEGGFTELPQYLQDYVTAWDPDFADAPRAYSQPNETIWTGFKKLAESGLLENLNPE